MLSIDRHKFQKEKTWNLKHKWLNLQLRSLPLFKYFLNLASFPFAGPISNKLIFRGQRRTELRVAAPERKRIFLCAARSKWPTAYNGQ